MAQFDFGVIDPNVKTGTQLAADLNQWRTALHTTHAGAARPAYAQPGTLWVDQSAADWQLKMTTTTSDTVIGGINPTTNQFRLTAAPQIVINGGWDAVPSNFATAPLLIQSSGGLQPGLALHNVGVAWVQTMASGALCFACTSNTGPAGISPWSMIVNADGSILARAFNPITVMAANSAPLTGALEDVLKLRGVRWVEAGTAGIGLQPDEVALVYPELVSDAPAGKAVNYMALAAPIIEAIRELNDRLTALENRLTALESSPVKRDPPFWAVAVLALVLAFVVMALAGCSQMKLVGGCEYERTITTRYVCPTDGTIQHNRLAPWNPEL